MKLALALLAFNWTFGCDGSAIATIDAQGSPTRLLTADPCVVEGAPRAAYPDVTADGRTILFVRGTRLALMDADGSDVRVLPIATESEPAIAPGGRQVAYTQVRRGRSWVWTARSDGSGRRRLRAGSEPDFSRNGRRIAYVSPTGAVVVIGLDGAVRQRIATRAAAVDWAPTGPTMLMTTRGGRLRLISGGDVVPAPVETDRVVSAAWAPDGRGLAYVRELPADEEELRYGVYTVRFGSAPRRIYATDEERVEETLEPLTLTWGVRPPAARAAGD